MTLSQNRIDRNRFSLSCDGTYPLVLALPSKRSSPFGATDGGSAGLCCAVPSRVATFDHPRITTDRGFAQRLSYVYGYAWHAPWWVALALAQQPGRRDGPDDGHIATENRRVHST
jgi:hypothetical protein